MEEKESLPRWVARIDAIFAKGDDVDALREAMGNHGKVKQAGRCVVLVTPTWARDLGDAVADVGVCVCVAA